MVLWHRIWKVLSHLNSATPDESDVNYITARLGVHGSPGSCSLSLSSWVSSPLSVCLIHLHLLNIPAMSSSGSVAASGAISSIMRFSPSNLPVLFLSLLSVRNPRYFASSDSKLSLCFDPPHWYISFNSLTHVDMTHTPKAPCNMSQPSIP